MRPGRVVLGRTSWPPWRTWGALGWWTDSIALRPWQDARPPRHGETPCPSVLGCWMRCWRPWLWGAWAKGTGDLPLIFYQKLLLDTFGWSWMWWATVPPCDSAVFFVNIEAWEDEVIARTDGLLFWGRVMVLSSGWFQCGKVNRLDHTHNMFLHINWSYFAFFPSRFCRSSRGP